MKKLIVYAVAFLTVTGYFSCKSKSSSGSASTPKEAMMHMMSESEGGDVKTVMNHMCSGDRKLFEQSLEMAKSFGVDVDKLMKENMQKMMEKQGKKDDVEFGAEKIDGNNATLEMKNKKTGETANMTFVKEDGTWKMCPSQMREAREAMQNMPKMSDSLDKMMNNPEMKEGMKKMQEAMKDPKFQENMEQLKEAMEKAKNN